MMLALAFLAGCVEDKKEKAQIVIQDPVLREEIFHVIQNDSTMLRDLMVNMVSFTEDPERYSMRYRMMKLVLNSPVMDSLLVNDSNTRMQLFQKMLVESDHNPEFRQEMSNAISRHENLANMINSTLKNP